ncbi:MAG: hypothetical protein KJ904_02040 [Alphaproteobacteria bacterium]|nr:hypothetical protein [Alphaproteobacteria bacterium]MBU0798654.1 hypothetical protein [Alphaproteobacteria bacterium]MBU0885917.1 hypothetical protein [Alphaproteobacteria bacterium]MBU1811906.1 hypothetical protein [Alphaproteobacteria bacterium]MBU2091719.1 hypothetical protein [Alphaproteobacteria bacterium]
MRPIRPLRYGILIVAATAGSLLLAGTARATPDVPPPPPGGPGMSKSMPGSVPGSVPGAAPPPPPQIQLEKPASDEQAALQLQVLRHLFEEKLIDAREYETQRQRLGQSVK